MAVAYMETAVPEDLSKDYIKTLLSIVEEDKKAILLYVAFDLAVVSLTLSEKLLQDKGGREPFIAFGLGLLLIAAALFFSYFRKMHLATFEIANCLLTLDTARAREIPKDVWTEHKTGYIAAYVVQLLGLALLIACYVAA